MVSRIAVVGLAIASVVGAALPADASLNAALSLYIMDYCRFRVDGMSIESAVSAAFRATRARYPQYVYTDEFADQADYRLSFYCTEKLILLMRRNKLEREQQKIELNPLPPRSVIRQWLEESIPYEH